MHRIAAALLCLSLLGCSVSNGHALTEAQIKQFSPGRSTRAEVQAALGPPSSAETNSDGTTTLTYQWGTNTAAGQSYIPLVGPFIAKSNYAGSTVTYLFNPDGRLRSFKREDENRPQGVGT